MKSTADSCRIGLVALWVLAWASSGRAQATLDYDIAIKQGTALLEAGQGDLALASGEAAVKGSPGRWEGYALTGRSLISLRRYEPAAQALSKAIELAPSAEQVALRELRRQCLLAESRSTAPAMPAVAAVATGGAVQPQSTDAKMTLEVARRTVNANNAVWVDASTGLAWARPWYYPPGSNGPWDFSHAQAFCSTLSLVGYSNWRLPTAEELQHIFLASSSGWRWSVPRFDEGYGVNDALKRGTWRLASFSLGRESFRGDRLLIWTGTPGDRDGEHAAFYFGVRHSVQDGLKTGESLWGHMLNPFQGYALCVRATTS
jgi:Protein of unknown function (DUF1566)